MGASYLAAPLERSQSKTTLEHVGGGQCRTAPQQGRIYNQYQVTSPWGVCQSWGNAKPRAISPRSRHARPPDCCTAETLLLESEGARRTGGLPPPPPGGVGFTQPGRGHFVVVGILSLLAISPARWSIPSLSLSARSLRPDIVIAARADSKVSEAKMMRAGANQLLELIVLGTCGRLHSPCELVETGSCTFT